MPAQVAPTVINDWRFATSVQYVGATPVAMRQALLRGIKEHLIGNGTWLDGEGEASSISDPWDVVMSSDASVAGAADRWDADSDLTWAAEGNAHSWIVLRHANYFGPGNPLYWLINCNPASTQNATLMMSFSRVGYTGGTTTARPTATDEHIVRPVAGNVTTAGWQGDDNSTVSTTMRVHFLMTDDGRKLYMFMTRNSVCIAMWLLVNFDDDEDGEWDEPYVFHIASEDFVTSGEAEVLTYTHFYSASNRLLLARDQSGGLGDFTIEAMIPSSQSASQANSAPGTALNPFTGGWVPCPVLIRGVSIGGLLGFLPDIWFGRIAAGSGSPGSDPNDGAPIENAFMQFGTFVVPWDRSTILMG